MCKDYIRLQLAIFTDHFNLVKVSVCVRIHTSGGCFLFKILKIIDCEAKGLLQLYTRICWFCQDQGQSCPCAHTLHSKGLRDCCRFLWKCPSLLKKFTHAELYIVRLLLSFIPVRKEGKTKVKQRRQGSIQN